MAGTILQQIHDLQKESERQKKTITSLKKEIKEIKERLDVGVIRYGGPVQ